MSTPAVTARLSQTGDIASLVLEAERSALAGVEQCRQQALGRVAASRLQAKRVHRRGEARIERLRGRMAATAQARLAQIGGEIAALSGAMGASVPTLAPLDAAIARMTEELAGSPEKG